MSVLRWTEEQLSEYRANMQRLAGRDIPVKLKMSKYRNVKTQVNGRTFDSKIEAERYLNLLRMQDAGLISELRCQVSFELAPAVVICGKKIRPLRYVADFCYTQDGKAITEDVKGCRTDVYKLKRHLMKTVHGIDVHEYRKPKRA